MILILLWMLANLKKWDAFCAIVCNKKSRLELYPKLEKVMYNKDHGITTMSHHGRSEHSTILKLYQMQCSNWRTPMPLGRLKMSLNIETT
jgi:hypothetical protein